MRLRPARHQDLPAITALLAGESLPAEDVAGHLATFLVGEQGGMVVATGGLEALGHMGLLRSVVVTPRYRGRGWGRRIAAQLIGLARSLNIADVYLLTTTAPDFFATLGFRQEVRETAPPAVRGTRQFATLCPASAVLMYLNLK